MEIRERVRQKLSADNAAQSFAIAVTVAAGVFEALTAIGQISKGEPIAAWASTAAITFLLFVTTSYAVCVKRSNSLQIKLMGILDAYEVQVCRLADAVAKARANKGEPDDSV